jgi:hypothetical protein
VRDWRDDAGNVRLEANAANDRGPVTDDFTMGHIFFSRSERHEIAFDDRRGDQRRRRRIAQLRAGQRDEREQGSEEQRTFRTWVPPVVLLIETSLPEMRRRSMHCRPMRSPLGPSAINFACGLISQHILASNR